MAEIRKPNQPILYNGTATPYMALFNSGRYAYNESHYWHTSWRLYK